MSAASREHVEQTDHVNTWDLLQSWLDVTPARCVERIARIGGIYRVTLSVGNGSRLFGSQTQTTLDGAIRSAIMIAWMEGER